MEKIGLASNHNCFGPPLSSLSSNGWNLWDLPNVIVTPSLRFMTLVGWWLSHPSEKYEFVSWDYYSQYMETCLTCFKPPTSWLYHTMYTLRNGMMTALGQAAAKWRSNKRPRSNLEVCAGSVGEDFMVISPHIIGDFTSHTGFVA